MLGGSARLAELLKVEPALIDSWEAEGRILSFEETEKIGTISGFSMKSNTSRRMFLPLEKIGMIDPSKTRHPSDSTAHEIFDAKLKGDALLHRFSNRTGVPYSALYVGGFEAKAVARERELFMIVDYQIGYVWEKEKMG